ncbi:cache domain-containing sensor histidine kinase [Clostridium thermarum]|uniref:cache domain-containing sensor histidine kinase n=1 Tax=Clostridium thermarum TaxID=1716543 RepID=UPI0011238124|nr:sensor histidine kinase [Clostridium thermarum]
MKLNINKSSITKSRLSRIIEEHTGFFRNIKIQYRLLILMLAISLVPLIIISVFSYENSINALTKKISAYSVQVMDQISENIGREIDRFENDSIEIGYSDIVQETLLNYDSLSSWQVLNRERKMKEMMMKKFSLLHDVSDVLIYTNKMERITAYGDSGFPLNFTDTYFYNYQEEIHKEEGKPVWKSINPEGQKRLVNFATEEEQISKSNGILIGRAIKSLNDGDIIGSLMIRINERYFANIYRNIDLGQGSDIFVIDRKGIVISSINKDISLGKLYKNVELISNIINNSDKGNRTFNLKIDNHLHLVAFTPIVKTDWFVVSTIPYAYLNSESASIGFRILLFGLICSILAIILSYFFSKSISLPLKRLVHSMNLAKGGDLSVNIKDESKDEIGEVARNFNVMVYEIKNLMENVKSKERQKRDAEFKALQAQINPHFLSNTLNTVKWLANIQRAENIENLITSLIQLLHANMGKGETLVTVNDEIEYIKNYINIQEYRYFNKFVVNYDLEEKILNYRIPKFTLQPVVENALIHGIEPMEGQGVIVIKGYEYNGTVKISITDNGIGISEKKLATLLGKGENVDKRRLSGIGINNVNERIKMYFGEQYGLTINSIEGLYTTVEISFPILK